MGPVRSPRGIVVSSFTKNRLLLPYHGSSTLRAFTLNAGRAAFVRFRLSAFRAQAGAESAPCKRTAYAASSLPASTLALSAAFSHSPASSSVHFVFLLAYAAHSPTTTATAWHGKGIEPQIAFEPSLNDLAKITGH
jgi:hypothetical protein